MAQDNLPQRQQSIEVQAAERMSRIEGIKERAMRKMDQLADAYVSANEKPLVAETPKPLPPPVLVEPTIYSYEQAVAKYGRGNFSCYLPGGGPVAPGTPGSYYVPYYSACHKY